MTGRELIEAVEQRYLKRFPNGYTAVCRHALGTGGYLSFGLTKEQSDCPWNIRNNDKMDGCIHFHNVDLNAEITGKLVVDGFKAAISCLPESQYYVMSHERVAFRKVNNTTDKILVAFDKYFDKLLSRMKELIAEEKIYNQSEIKEIYLTFGE